MTRINVPDPQHTELEALDEAFFAWYQQMIDSDDSQDVDDANGYLERWNDCPASEPLTYTQESIEEAYGPDWEEGWEVANLAMSKDLQQEIDLKWKIVREINAF